MNELNFQTYQQQATSYATYSNTNYPYFAIVEEVGEFCGKIAKNMRGDRNAEETKAAMRKEAGDILWNLSEICTLNGWSLQDIAQENLNKLADRAARDKIKGDGDDR